MKVKRDCFCSPFYFRYTPEYAANPPSMGSTTPVMALAADRKSVV